MDYSGISEELLNERATLEAYSPDELVMVTNALWRRAYGKDVIDPIEDDKGRDSNVSK